MLACIREPMYFFKKIMSQPVEQAGNSAGLLLEGGGSGSQPSTIYILPAGGKK